MEMILISFIAFVIAILTFFSGFGLGTLLTPVFMLYFPVELAIALTGVVHLFNNIFKLFLVGKNVDLEVFIRFGIPAVFSAFLGAWLLVQLTDLQPLFSYMAFGKKIEIFPVKFTISILLFLFACLDLFPFLTQLKIEKKLLPLGGVLSGFFGGLSGNQGALRTAFLMKAGLTKESMIATAVVVSALVDISRLSFYATGFWEAGLTEKLDLVFVVTAAGILGSFLGNNLIKKITYSFLQKIVAVFLLLISIGMAVGIL